MIHYYEWVSFIKTITHGIQTLTTINLFNGIEHDITINVHRKKFANNAWNPLMKDSKWHLSSNESQTRYAWLPIVGFNDNHNESLNQLFLDLFGNSISYIVLIILQICNDLLYQ